MTDLKSSSLILRIPYLLLVVLSCVGAFSVDPRSGNIRTRPRINLLSVFAVEDPLKADDAILSKTPSLLEKAIPASSYRRVRRMEKFARLPVWPAWNGVFIWLLQQIAGNDVAAKLESAIGGRVGPNFYEYAETDPFVMLVHHCHTFSSIDPLRFFQRTFFPEGFPAHPHRGFVTITYFLAGGFVHRDSTGIRQLYGTEPQHAGKHTQWLNTGRGMLHEEMFDLQSPAPEQGPLSFLQPRREELYQIWLNVPARHKFDEPSTVLLGGGDETPVVKDGSASTTLVLAGSYQGQTANAPIQSDLALFHVTLAAGATWSYDIPASFATAFLYLRQGSLTVVGDDKTTTIPVHHTAYFEPSGDTLSLTAAGKDGADFMFLAGAPLQEPCVASGSMVMTSAQEINQAYTDYQMGRFGQPWGEKLSDKEWKKHVEEYPPF